MQRNEPPLLLFVFDGAPRLTYTPFSAILERMEYIARMVETRLADMLARGRSTLLLGARQTGKTTLAQRLNPDMQFNFIRPEVRQRYERRPELLGNRYIFCCLHELGEPAKKYQAPARTAHRLTPTPMVAIREPGLTCIGFMRLIHAQRA